MLHRSPYALAGNGPYSEEVEKIEVGETPASQSSGKQVANYSRVVPGHAHDDLEDGLVQRFAPAITSEDASC
jgi:hypothetical protein